MDTATVAIEEIAIDREHIQFRESLNKDWVDQLEVIYREDPNQLPALDVVELTEDYGPFGAGDLLLTSGFHRIEAARHAGLEEIAVRIKQGTYEQAQEWAALSNKAHGLQYTAAERRKLVPFLFKRHPKWSESRLAKETGYSRDTINGMLRALRVRHALADVGIPTDVTDSHLDEIGRLPKEDWLPALRAAQWQKWSVSEAKTIVKLLLDPETSAEERDTILQSKMSAITPGSAPEPKPAAASTVSTGGGSSLDTGTKPKHPVITPIKPASTEEEEDDEDDATVIAGEEDEDDEEEESDDEARRKNVHDQRHADMQEIKDRIDSLEVDKDDYVDDVSEEDIADLRKFAHRLDALATYWYDALHPQQQVAQ